MDFENGTPSQIKSRITYAFQVFAAIYGHEVVQAASAEIRCLYARARPTNPSPHLCHIPALYQEERKPGEWFFHKVRYAEQDFFLNNGVDGETARPDWLGEIFLWLSGGYESTIIARDSIGRIPYSETVFAQQGLSPLKPHVSLLMAWLENALRQDNQTEALPKAPSPIPGVEHLVLCSHDVDYCFTNRASALLRLIKNLGIAARQYRSWSYFKDNLRMLAQLFAGRRVGDYLPALIAASSEHDFKSTFFAVARRGHRRDPDYQIEQLSPQLRLAVQNGFSIGLHGSYRSVMDEPSLATEARRLRSSTGEKVISGRQHWLRFGRHRELFEQVAESGLLVDSSLGFPDMVGFRNGASFAFPPYDFEREMAHPFLEIPLILMDGSLQTASRQLGTPSQNLAEQVLNESRNSGWGGGAILWHNPIEPLSVPAEINRVFWECADRRKNHQEKWMSTDQFLAASISRYQAAGLLRDARLDR